MINKNNFMGLDGFVWWFGIVENRKDPLSIGRCQVRIFGWHTENKQLVPTRDLPFAHPIIPLGSNTGSMVAPKEGEMVFGFFMDGDDGQYPVMLGTVPGIPDGTPRIDKGFSDPRDSSALNQAPRIVTKRTYNEDSSGAVIEDEAQKRFPSFANEPSVSRLARNEGVDDTIVGVKKQTAVQNILTASEGFWSEPQTKYAAQYPYNHVYESESGHVVELDDTPGAERVHIAHRTGTFDEMHPDGTRVMKVVKDKYEIVLSDNNVMVYGDCNITINGRGSIFVRGDADLKVGGNMKTSVKGTYEVVSTGNMKFVSPRIDFNPPGETPTYREQQYDPKTAVLEKRQVPGGSGSFNFAGVDLQVSPNYSASPDYVPNDAPKDTTPEQANTETPPPITCGDFSDPLTDADYDKYISPNYKLRNLSIGPGPLFPWRINAQRGRSKRTEPFRLFSESEIACNLQALAVNCLEPLRKQYPGMRINSVFRVGEDEAQHGIGEAADVSWPSKSKAELLEICRWASANLQFDQIIYEIPANSPNGWLHISFNRRGNLTGTGRPRLLTWRGGGYETGLNA